MFERPDFYWDCEKWRSRTICSGVMEDVYDGNIWKSFECYAGKPFLSGPGNLALILTFFNRSNTYSILLVLSICVC